MTIILITDVVTKYEDTITDIFNKSKHCTKIKTTRKSTEDWRLFVIMTTSAQKKYSTPKKAD